MGHEGADQLGVLLHEGSVHGAAAAGEDLDRPGAEGADQGARSAECRTALLATVLADAAPDAAGGRR